ncbi:Ribonucleoside-diphosphate reductase [Gammaproteobacteria bacterium]
MKPVHLKTVSALTSGILIQPVSVDIFNKKYRLKDKNGHWVDQSIEDTFQRVARALADVEIEEIREKWYQEFLWALNNGAIPAGRILSNAGAAEYKPSTSTINCTVSEHVQDSMDGILHAVHQAGLTLHSGAGIGYCFSTLRPKGAFVSGAGSYTSGPLSFMDIFDKMCSTVSSAGGRRGAQMATFDVSHPDILEFIRAKREDGRLRQFNLSVLITKEFMEAVEKDAKWVLSFPIQKNHVKDKSELEDQTKVIWRKWPITEGYFVNKDGLVACKVYKELPARRLWDTIMASTYDYAEPGFILIDEVNENNNLWWCEEITATNPCVTGDTRLYTNKGMPTVRELYETKENLDVSVDIRTLGQAGHGIEIRSAVPVFKTSEFADVFTVTTKHGYEIKATEWHEFYTNRGKLKLKDLQIGDNLLIQSGKGSFGEKGDYGLGLVIGLITGDGHITNKGDREEVACIGLWGENRSIAPTVIGYINEIIEGKEKGNRKYTVSSVEVKNRYLISISSTILAKELAEHGFTKESKHRVPEIIWQGSEECVKGYLHGLFQTDGCVQLSEKSQTCSVRLSSSYPNLLKDVQMLLANFGIFSGIYKRRDSGFRMMPDGKGGRKEYWCQPNYDLIIDGESRNIFMIEIGFPLKRNERKFLQWKEGTLLRKTQSFESKIENIVYYGTEPVYDTTQPDHNSVIFNGIVTGQCGEQALPPNGSCLLGSINLTKFISNPFTDKVSFDWNKFEKVVTVFTRMLDNVVEINGLPLPEQRHEITHKRRHGMGYLGLGSTLTMLKISYGSPESVKFTERVTKELALFGWRVGSSLVNEKGPAPIFEELFEITPAIVRLRPALLEDGYQIGEKVKGKVLFSYSNYMDKIRELDPKLVEEIKEHGCRFTHHSSIAPTGTISLSLGNNASNGVEPSFAHQYSRNIIQEGRKTKEKVDVYSYEFLEYKRLIDPNATVDNLPSYFVTASDIPPKAHVDIQAAAQKWVDSSISKTINIPTNFPYEDFKGIYRYAYDQGLKGCTTFRYNPAAFQGVLVKEKDLEATKYRFVLESGEVVELKGNEEVEYEGETHTAANLFDAMKEGYYGKL